MKVYLNGEFVDQRDAMVSVFDTGFLLGEGLFETMRSYNGWIFALDKHLERLIKSAEVLEFQDVPDKASLAYACETTLAVNNLSDARMRLTMTAGLPDAISPTVIITAMPFSGYDKELYELGMSAVILPGYRFSNNPFSRLKATSYLPSLVARRKAIAAGCDEALLINEDGNVAEGSYSNFFGVKNGGLCTPSVINGVLPGVTRNIVIDLAITGGFPVTQRCISADGLIDMDEMFLTNSLMGIMPLTTVDGRKVQSGRPGPITLELIGLYQDLIDSSSWRIGEPSPDDKSSCERWLEDLQ